MDEKKSSPDFSETLDWSKIMEEDEQFCADVLSSDRSIIEKINLLRSNPYSCDDIVTEMLLHAPYMENFIEEREVFAPNTSLSEFISTNVNRFDALEACWKELKADEALYKANRRLALDISTAVTIRDIFETDNMVSYVPADCTNVQLVKDFCADALAIVEISAIYFIPINTYSFAEIIPKSLTEQIAMLFFSTKMIFRKSLVRCGSRRMPRAITPLQILKTVNTPKTRSLGKVL